MPLKPGSSPATTGFNIKELVKSGQQKGRIGNGPPKSGPALQKQAVAIALNKAGKSNKDKVKPKAKSPMMMPQGMSALGPQL